MRLDVAVRQLRLPYLRAAAPEVLATARAQRWEPAEMADSTPDPDRVGRPDPDEPDLPRRATAGA